MGFTSDSAFTEDSASRYRRSMLFDIAQIFKRAAPADRCWLVERIKEAQRRIHSKAKKDDVDEALAIIGE